MITEIGKELRRLRIDRDERLIDMADRLGKSAAFISAIETGKKTPPSGFEDLVADVYRLSDDAVGALYVAADRSRRTFTLEPNSSIARDTAGLMARRMNSLSEDQFRNILNILNKEKTRQ